MRRIYAPFLLLSGLVAGCEHLWNADMDKFDDRDDCDPYSELNDCDGDGVVIDTGGSDGGGDGGEDDTSEPQPDPPCDPIIWYRDADLDGYGSALVTLQIVPERDASGDCPTAGDYASFSYGDTGGVTVATPPDGYVDNSTDCDDGNAEVHPDADELCNGLDDDCDSVVDPNTSVDASVWIIDADADGYGDAELSESTLACEQPAGYAGNASDCDDANPAANPNSEEIPHNGVDDDCDSLIDEEPICCVDYDGDGYGDPDQCRVPSQDVCDEGEVSHDGDCNDRNSTVHPGAYDSPYDSRDADCDGLED